MVISAGPVSHCQAPGATASQAQPRYEMPLASAKDMKSSM